MWDLTVPGNNDHDFYVLPAQTAGHHASDDVTGGMPILVHNASFCPKVDTVANDWIAKGLHAKMSTGEEVSFFGTQTDDGFEIGYRPSFLGQGISARTAKEAAASLNDPGFRADMLKNGTRGLEYLRQNAPNSNQIPGLENLISALGGTP